METLTTYMVVLVAIQHFYFLVLEMFFWTKPLGLRTFNLKPDYAIASKSLAANQGLYNGFLAAGLVWGVISDSNGLAITIYFLTCIVIAGIFGGYTVSRKILYIQALPALLTLILLCVGK